MFMGGAVDLNTLKARTAPLEARRQELNALLSEAAPQTVHLHSGVAEAYQRLAEDLQHALEGDAGEHLRTELHNLIERVDFIPLQGLGKFRPAGSLQPGRAAGPGRHAESRKPHGQEPWGFCRSEPHVRV